MKALTLTQPWASLVALGDKRIETRSWRTPYRGPIAIHAAKGFPNEAKELIWQEPFLGCLRQAGLVRFNVFIGVAGEGEAALPVGAVLAIARLVNCVPTGSPGTEQDLDQWGASNERAFGDYSPGRFAWLLADIKPLDEPIPAKGSLGVWDWPVSVEQIPGSTALAIGRKAQG